MHKIDTPTADENGEFVNNDPTANPPVDATRLNAEWFNSVQRELLNILALFGVEPDAANDAQVVDVLKRIGVKSGIWGTNTANGNDVDTTSFNGSHVIFHTAENFTIDLLKTGSVVMVIPYWGGDAPESIVVNYVNSSHHYTVKKGQMLVGVVGNGTSSYNNAQFVVRYMPIMLNPDGDMNMRDANVRDIVARQITVTNLVPVNRFETGFVTFSATEDPSAEGLQDWQTWQLMENWKLGQVKRVYCTDAQSSGTGVTVFFNSSGNYKSIKFYPEGYREFVCIGTYTVSGETSYDFAILVVNGSRN